MCLSPVIPGLEGFDVGFAPSSNCSALLDRGPSTKMSASSISSHTPPIWRKWSSPPSERKIKNYCADTSIKGFTFSKHIACILQWKYPSEFLEQMVLAMTKLGCSGHLEAKSRVSMIFWIIWLCSIHPSMWVWDFFTYYRPLGEHWKVRYLQKVGYSHNSSTNHIIWSFICIGQIVHNTNSY